MYHVWYTNYLLSHICNNVRQNSAIVNKVWSFCNTLRDDGVGYGDYLEQLIYLLFLKMADAYAYWVVFVILQTWRLMTSLG